MADKFIDIERIIQDKNPQLLKILPQFIINYLKRITHQNEVNEILEDFKDIYDYEFCAALIKRLNIKTVVSGLENIPKEDGFIFASNHPLGGMDAMALVTVIAPYRKDVKFIVNDILLNLNNLKGIFTGVNKHGGNTKNSLKLVDETKLNLLKKHMEVAQPFLNPSLNLKELAKQIDLPPRELSGIINQGTEQSFFDFINSYRIQFAKDKIQHTKDDKMTILEVMYAAGFNSKSSFNTAFKKHTNLTPTQWKKSTNS